MNQINSAILWLGKGVQCGKRSWQKFCCYRLENSVWGGQRDSSGESQALALHACSLPTWFEAWHTARLGVIPECIARGKPGASLGMNLKFRINSVS